MDAAFEALARAGIHLTSTDLFLGHLFSGLARTLEPSRWPLRLCTRPQGYVLTVSPEAFGALDEREHRVALEHELLHLVFRHPQRGAAYVSADSERFGLACDLVVNQYLHQGPLLPDMLALHHFDPPMPSGLTAEAYYARLTSQCHGGTGCCGSMPDWARDCLAGRPATHSPNPWVSQCDLLLVQLADCGLERRLVQAALRTGLTKCIGRLPGHIAERLMELVTRWEGTLPWREVLRRFSTSSRKSRIRNTMRRRSKRYGTFPGIVVARRHRVAVCVDTSGSIGDAELDRFFAEVDQIHRAGAFVEVFEADAKVQARYEYRGRPPIQVHGRGGTNFEPALRAVATAPERFDACVYLTDGFAGCPSVRPRCPLLWVVSPQGTPDTSHLPFGRVVRMH